MGSQPVLPGDNKDEDTHEPVLPVRTRVTIVVSVLAVVGALTPAALSDVSHNYFVSLALHAIGIFIVFFNGLFGGFGVGWEAWSSAVSALEASPVAAPLILGLLAGVAVTIVQRWLWWLLQDAEPFKKTLASTVVSKEFWTGTAVDSARLVLMNLAVAYGVIALMSAFALFAAAPNFVGELQQITAAGGNGGLGGDGTASSLLFAFFFALGVLVGLGALSGMAMGALSGGVFGGLAWAGLGTAAVKGAAKNFVITAFEADPDQQYPFTVRVAIGAFVGAYQGVMSGALVARIMGLLHLLGFA